MVDVLAIGWGVAFWIIVIALLIRHRRRGGSFPVPMIAAPVLYGWFKCETMLLWIIYLWNHKRIARFLKLADHLRMRKQRVDRILTDRSGR